MCTFNGARFLREQCESFRHQTRLPDEVVICDDQSTDETVSIIKAFAGEAPFPVRLHINQRRLGTSRNFEKAIGLSGGDLIFLSDQDDVWCKEKLLRFEKAFDSSPETGLIFSDALLIDRESKPIGKYLWELVKFNSRIKRKFASGRQFEVLLKRNYITGTTMAFRRSFSELVCPIPVTMRIVHDSWIGFLISYVSHVEFIDEPLVMYRIHDGQQIGAVRGRSSARPFDNEPDEDQAEFDFPVFLQKILDRYKPLNDPHLNFLTGKIDHLRIRWHVAQKPHDLYPWTRRLMRLYVVFRELISGHYHRYSSGLLSVAHDVKQILR